MSHFSTRGAKIRLLAENGRAEERKFVKGCKKKIPLVSGIFGWFWFIF